VTYSKIGTIASRESTICSALILSIKCVYIRTFLSAAEEKLKSTLVVCDRHFEKIFAKKFQPNLDQCGVCIALVKRPK